MENTDKEKEIKTQLAGQLEYPVSINVKTLLDAGAHFGHQTERWNPKMLPNIFGAKNGVHIINLDITARQWEKARKFVVDLTAQGGNVLFVGTKQQARDVIRQEAERCGSYYVTQRWLGGTLSNFQTLKNSIEKMRKLEDLLNASKVEGSKYNLRKKEKLKITKDLDTLSKTLGGIRNMRKPADLLFIIDVTKEHIAVSEAVKLHIPVVAVVDTNSDPSKINYPIAANDDALKSIGLLAAGIADAVLEGKAIYNSRTPKEQQSNNQSGNVSSSRRKQSSNSENIAVETAAAV